MIACLDMNNRPRTYNVPLPNGHLCLCSPSSAASGGFCYSVSSHLLHIERLFRLLLYLTVEYMWSQKLPEEMHAFVHFLREFFFRLYVNLGFGFSQVNNQSIKFSCTDLYLGHFVCYNSSRKHGGEKYEW